MDPIIYAIMFCGAVVLALLVPIGLILGNRISAKATDTFRAAAILVLITVGALLIVVASPRDLSKLFSPMYRLEFEPSQSSIWAARLASFTLIAFCLSWLFDAVWRQPRNVQADPARPLLISALIYLFGLAIVNAVGSTEPSWGYKSLYIPIVLSGLYLQRNANALVVTRIAKSLLVFVCFCSLLVAAFRPDFALERPYATGLIPGLNFRLYGVAPHANALGPIALLYLILEIHSPWKWQLRWPAAFVALLCFVLAQAKAAWFAAVIIALIAFFHHTSSRQKTGNMNISLLYLTIFFVLGASLATALSFFDLNGYIERHSDLTTLVGRTTIWRITMDEWQRNPLFGYGAELWGEEFREKYGLLWVGQAHNQFVQTLGQGGLFGLALLLQYLAVLLYLCVRQARCANVLPLMLFIIIVLRCISESPMNPMGVLEWGFWEHSLLFLLLAQCVRGEGRSTIGAALPLRPAPMPASIAVKRNGDIANPA